MCGVAASLSPAASPKPLTKPREEEEEDLPHWEARAVVVGLFLFCLFVFVLFLGADNLSV